MSDFLNYLDRGYTFDFGELVQKEKTLVVDGCSMAGSRDDNQDYLDIIQHAMWRVVNEKGVGTASHLGKIRNIEIAGKTGTSQVYNLDKGKTGTKKLQDHALFISYAPFNNPEIVEANPSRKEKNKIHQWYHLADDMDHKQALLVNIFYRYNTQYDVCDIYQLLLY